MIGSGGWQAHLHKGERLLWQGGPYPALGLIAPSRAEALAGLIGALAVAALLVLRSRDAALSPGLAIAILIAALLATGAPFRAMQRRRRALRAIRYAVTDRRVLTLGAGGLHAAPIPRGAAAVLRPGAHGLHDLDFGTPDTRLPHLRDGARIAALLAPDATGAR